MPENGPLYDSLSESRRLSLSGLSAAGRVSPIVNIGCAKDVQKMRN
jgi:hypothetical protein